MSPAPWPCILQSTPQTSTIKVNKYSPRLTSHVKEGLRQNIISTSCLRYLVSSTLHGNKQYKVRVRADKQKIKKKLKQLSVMLWTLLLILILYVFVAGVDACAV